MSAPVDVIAVLDAEIASLPVMAEMMSGHDGDAFDAEEAVRRMSQARAAIAILLSAAKRIDAGHPDLARVFGLGEALYLCGVPS